MSPVPRPPHAHLTGAAVLEHRLNLRVAAQAYDAVAGTQGLTMSRYATPKESRRQFPTLAEHGPGGNPLLGTVSCSPP